MEHSVLFVDDEQNILKTLERLLRKENYKQFYCRSGQEALEVLDNNRISVIVSDMRMPEMNGVEFLREAEKKSPESIKIILSGYSDVDDILSAVNDGRIHGFIKKPWNDEALKIRLNNSFEYYSKAIREKELMEELSRKNSELEDLNQNLERIVKRRTYELEQRSNLLQMIVEGKPVEQIMSTACSILRTLLNLNEVILLDVKTGIFYPDDQKPPEKILHRQEIGKNIIINKYLCYQIEHNKKLFGYLYFYPVDKVTSEIKRKIKSYSSLLEMILMQKTELENSDALVDHIDEIMEELNAN